MLQSLFPYGQVLAFLLLIPLCMFWVLAGVVAEQSRVRRQQAHVGVDTMALLLALIVIAAYLFYHFIGWLGSA